MPPQIQIRNIAELTRSHYGFGLGSSNDINALAQKLYGESVRTLPTKKGVWRIHERTGYSIPTFLDEERQPATDGFCAVYRREHRKYVTTTMFMGNLEDRAVVDTVADELARNVLEQRKWFAWPPYGLTESSGKNYGNIRGLIGVGAAEVGTMYFLRDWQLFQNAINTFNEYATKSPGKAGVAVFVGIVVPMVVGGIVGSRIGKRLGKRADEMRVRNLPEQAHYFLYGDEAEKAMQKEVGIIKDEAIKEEAYKFLIETTHSDISRQEFLKLRDNLLACIFPSSMD